MSEAPGGTSPPFEQRLDEAAILTRSGAAARLRAALAASARVLESRRAAAAP